MSLFIFFILLKFNSHAEYRAFELAITNPTTNQSRVVLSNLDHLQYPMYYPLQKDERIQIVSTWMCRDRTDNFQAICAKPAPPEATLAKPVAAVSGQPPRAPADAAGIRPKP